MIDKHIDHFDLRDPFLHLVLGMVSASQQLDRVLVETLAHVGETELREDQWTIDTVMGLISLQQTFLRSLPQLQVHARERQAVAVASETTLDGLLR